jgi:poly(3-hydroxybutyrate) depolymerase
MPVLVVTGTRDPVVPPGQWDDPGYTTTSNDTDRFYYTGSTAITRRWASALGCGADRDAVPFDAGVPRADCRTLCSADPGWPRVLDCRAPMGHVYELGWSWDLVLEFFARQSQ